MDVFPVNINRGKNLEKGLSAIALGAAIAKLSGFIALVRLNRGGSLARAWSCWLAYSEKVFGWLTVGYEAVTKKAATNCGLVSTSI